MIEDTGQSFTDSRVFPRIVALVHGSVCHVFSECINAMGLSQCYVHFSLNCYKSPACIPGAHMTGPP